MVIFLELYHFEREDQHGINDTFAKFQAIQDIGDDRYAALWNVTPGEENNAQFGPALSNFDKANAIDALVEPGTSLRHLTPDTRNRLYDEFGNLKEMSLFWQILLNKFVDAATVGIPPLIATPTGGGPEDDPSDQPGPRDISVIMLNGEAFHLDPEHPFFRAPFMSHAIARSEARAY